MPTSPFKLLERVLKICVCGLLSPPRMLNVQLETESTCQTSLLLGLYGQRASELKSLSQFSYSSWQNVSKISCSNQQKSFCLVWCNESAPLKHFFFSLSSSCWSQVDMRQIASRPLNFCQLDKRSSVCSRTDNYRNDLQTSVDSCGRHLVLLLLQHQH